MIFKVGHVNVIIIRIRMYHSDLLKNEMREWKEGKKRKAV
jgi:hypothetical protein